MTKNLTLLAILLLAVAGAAHAQTADPIETRQAGQDLMLGDFTGIRAVVAAKGDVTKLEQPAKALARWIKQFSTQFPPGSDTGHNTKALPAVWSDRVGFEKAADNFVETADKLAQLAKAGDADAVAAQVKVVTDACANCHNSFRAK